MSAVRQFDAFDGVFDDLDRGVRELVRDGKVAATVNALAINDSPLSRQLGMDAPFGTYPRRTAQPHGPGDTGQSEGGITA